MNEQDPLLDLNNSLTLIRDRVRGVAIGHHTGFYLFGRAGTSKTYTVKTTLDVLDCKYEYFDGHLTPMGLFELLDTHHDRVIVLDDVGQIFADMKALQILLAALGTQPEDRHSRPIKYRRQGKEETIHFTGGRQVRADRYNVADYFHRFKLQSDLIPQFKRCPADSAAVPIV